MEGENLSFDDCREREVLEDFCEEFPDRLSPIFLYALIVKAVVPIDLPVFMVSTKQGNPISVFDLEDEHVEEGFDTIEAAVHIVTHKQKISFLQLIM